MEVRGREGREGEALRWAGVARTSWCWPTAGRKLKKWYSGSRSAGRSTSRRSFTEASRSTCAVRQCTVGVSV
jgi:hypothetical protein